MAVQGIKNKGWKALMKSRHSITSDNCDVNFEFGRIYFPISQALDKLSNWNCLLTQRSHFCIYIQKKPQNTNSK